MASQIAAGYALAMERFAATIHALRIKRGMTLEELGGVVGVSKSAVGQWEKSKTVPDLPKLVELARFFGVSLAEMTGDTSQEQSIDAELRELDEATALILRKSFLASIQSMKDNRKP